MALSQKRRWSWIFCLLLGCVLWWGGFDGQPSRARAKFKLKLGGLLESSLFLGLQPSTSTIPQDNLGKFFNYRNSNRIAIIVTPKYGRKVAGKANIELRNLNFSDATLSSDVEDYNRLFPVSVRLNELYIDVYGLLPWLDLRIGQQRIAWGTASAFNPTDNINPPNLENPLAFNERLGVPAIKASVYMGEHVTLTLVGIPMYMAAILPIRLYRDTTNVDLSVALPPGMKVGKDKSNEIVQLPEFKLENMQAAAKLAVDISGINFSVSYMFARLFIPVPKKIPIVDAGLPDLGTLGECTNKPNRYPIPDRCVVNPTAKDVLLVYPRAHIIGADFATSLFGVGVWAEFALFIPVEKIETIITIPSLIPGDPPTNINPFTGKKMVTTAFNKEVFFKLTAGFDYTFPGGWYFNVQYVYGFFNEQDWNGLHHYGLLAFRKSFFREKLHIHLSAGFEVDATPRSGDARDGKKTGFAFLINPEIIYKPIDPLHLTLGGYFTRGNKGTTFNVFESLTQVYLRAKMVF